MGRLPIANHTQSIILLGPHARNKHPFIVRSRSMKTRMKSLRHFERQKLTASATPFCCKGTYLVSFERDPGKQCYS